MFVNFSLSFDKTLPDTENLLYTSRSYSTRAFSSQKIHITVKNIGKEISEVIKMVVIYYGAIFVALSQNTRCVIYVQRAITSQFWPVNKILPAVSLHEAEVTGFNIRI